jgi:tight adherence protein B
MRTETTILLLGALAAVILLTAFLLLRRVVERYRAHWKRRLSGPSGDSDSGILVSGAIAEPPRGMSHRMDEGFERMVEHSGLKVTPEQVLAFTMLLGVAVAVGLHLWRDELWLTTLGLVLGLAVPVVTFAILQARYRRRLQNQLPDAFYLLARSLRAGLSLEQALVMVGAQGPRPLADEFRKCNAQIQLGLSVPAAAQAMARRLRLIDFNAFASTVTLYQATGGNLALLLDRLAAGSRDRNQFRGHFLAATALGRATAIAIAAAVPVLLLGYLLFEPEHIQGFLQSTNGWIALAVAFGLQAVGIAWLYYLLRVEY